MQDIKEFHEQFYSSNNYNSQNAFLFKYIETIPGKRKRPKNKTHTEKEFQSKFFVRNKRNIKVPVCQKAFTGILNISRKRIDTVAKHSQKREILLLRDVEEIEK